MESDLARKTIFAKIAGYLTDIQTGTAINLETASVLSEHGWRVGIASSETTPINVVNEASASSSRTAASCSVTTLLWRNRRDARHGF